MHSSGLRFYPSTYIVTHDKTNLFNGDQADYTDRLSHAISASLLKVQNSKKTEADLSKLFFELLDDFGKARRDIAVVHETYHSKNFGVRRAHTDMETYYTRLHDVYEAYNTKLLRVFKTSLAMYNLRNKNHDKIYEKRKENFHGFEWSFELEVFEENELIDLKECVRNRRGLPKEITQWNKELSENPELSDFEVERTVENKILTHFPSLSRAYDLVNAFAYLERKFPYLTKSAYTHTAHNGNLKNFFALGTVTCFVGGKTLPLSRHMVWLYRDEKELSPVVRMQEHTTALVMHQRDLFVPETLVTISELFAKAIMSTKFDECKTYTGLFRALFSHAMPFRRGSASIGECFETLLYGYHGYQLRYNDKQLVDLEALTTPMLSTFMANYDAMIRLAPL